jgi:hypothetical protein
MNSFLDTAFLFSTLADLSLIKRKPCLVGVDCKLELAIIGGLTGFLGSARLSSIVEALQGETALCTEQSFQ